MCVLEFYKIHMHVRLWRSDYLDTAIELGLLYFFVFTCSWTWGIYEVLQTLFPGGVSYDAIG